MNYYIYNGQFYETDNLKQHGIKGMKWGVRRFQNKDGSPIINKGTIIKRVSTNKDDITYDNKKYVSINQKDHSKWESYIGEAYVKRNLATYSQTYMSTKDLKVMTSAKQGELYAKMLLDSKFNNQAMKDTEFATNRLGLRSSSSDAENISRNIAMQTETGKAFTKRVLEEGYDALIDTHGTNVSKNPVIVLNPDSNLTKYSEPEYTKPVQDYLKRYYGITA